MCNSNRLKVAVIVFLISTSAIASERSAKAVRQFKKQAPCPATGQIEKSCKGYVVDHVIALACGGADDPSNMQYQTIADAKEKDKWERKGCNKQTR